MSNATIPKYPVVGDNELQSIAFMFDTGEYIIVCKKGKEKTIPKDLSENISVD